MISSRTLLLALVGLNLVAFLMLKGFLPGLGSDERDPARLERQIAPEKIERVRPSLESSSRLPTETDPDNAGYSMADATDSGGLPGLGAAANQLARGVDAPAAGVSGSLTSTTLSLPSTEQSPEASAGSVGNADNTSAPDGQSTDSLASRENCVLFPETDYLSARAQIEQFAPSLARTSLKRLDAGSYLVFLDPLASKEAAEQRRDELVAAGIITAQVMTSGLLKNGIQLGLVRTAQAAKQRQQELLELGIDQALVGPLSVTTSRYQAQMWADTALIEQSVRPAASQAGLTLETCE